jgi:cysteine-rich repeat protein
MLCKNIVPLFVVALLVGCPRSSLDETGTPPVDPPPQAVCGDGVVEADEGCDDGNLDPADACTAACQLATCGDGILRRDLGAGEPGFEACDDGNDDEEDDCTSECVLLSCGDGVIAAGEECDDGNREDADGCLNNCFTARCGDGVVRTDLVEDDAGFERCDDANTADDDACLSDCSPASCGDGITRVDRVAGDDGFEACDDGDDDPNDACLNDCTAARCGDGILRADLSLGDAAFEACDDGNAIDADACLNGCTVAVCGDGVARVDLTQEDAGFESCDDGNAAMTDACLSDCSPARCGDGITRLDLDVGVEGYEACDDGDEVDTNACLNTCQRNGRTTQISSSGSANCLLSSGTVYCMGWNTYGLLGDGTTEHRNRPTATVGMSDVVQLASPCALKADGSVWCWGPNGVGQLGLGFVGDEERPFEATPGRVINLTDVVEISSGGAHTCARKSDGTLWCWGWNWDGACGDGLGPPFNYNSYRPTPVQVAGLTEVATFALGELFGCAIQTDGMSKCWGRNEFATLGTGRSGGRSLVPRRVLNDANFAQLIAARAHACARRTDGTVWCWGSGDALGNGSARNRAQPVRVSDLNDVRVIGAASADSTCALRGDGTVWCWGDNNWGVLGDGTTTDRLTPVQVVGLTNVEVIASGTGGFSNFAVTSDAETFAWGQNVMGSLGIGVPGMSGYTEPQRVEGF